ncbi:MAG: FprA family A-type flavoprotein [Pseudobutyrivibrio sp.]|nr:FprA family A-type flavoprotein [Pseudobutyrivibrio sp.]
MNNITNDIFYVGANDHEVDLFEGQFIVPNGMAYNSYVIMDDKIAIMDTIDQHFGDQWLANIKEVISDRKPDYLIVQHMEPDHSANIAFFMENYPDTTVVASNMAFVMMKNYFGTDYADKSLKIKEGDTLELGKHTLNFIAAPLVHWPEVMMTYDSTDKVLFSADGFGKFGALDVDEDWACEARRYYFGIVGPFGDKVQDVLKKAAGLEIATICPLHGPILSENLSYYLDLYNTWSSYGVEKEGVCIAYTSVYGHTKAAAELLEQELVKAGCPKVAITDLARDDMAEAVEDAFKYGKLVLATTTYNGGIFPFMEDFIHRLVERKYQNRQIGIIENGTWGPTVNKTITAMFENSSNITFANSTVSIKGSMTDENKAQIVALAKEMA